MSAPKFSREFCFVSVMLEPLMVHCVPVGGRDPKGAIKLNVQPGTYNYTMEGEGREVQSDKLKVEIGGTWAVVVFPEQGHMAEQMY